MQTKPYYFNIYLWDTHKDFCYKTKYTEEVGGCFHPEPVEELLDSDEVIPSRPKLGEIHLIKDKWDLEVVTHELCHALLLRLEILKPTFYDAIDYNDNISHEDICYEFGIWVETVYGWLWQINPSKKWRRK